MELKEAIEILKKFDCTDCKFATCEQCEINYDDVQAIRTVLAELDTITMNYTLLEEKFDGSAEEKVDKLTEELEKQK